MLFTRKYCLKEKFIIISQKIWLGLRAIAGFFANLKSDISNKKKSISFPRLIFAFVVLYFAYYSSQNNHLLFHFLFEILLVSTGIAIFFVIWNSYKFLDNHFFLIIGIAYLFVSTFAVMHLMLYEGTGIFISSDYQNNLNDMSMSFWVFARYFESISFLIATFYIKKRINSGIVFWLYFVSTSLIIYLVFNTTTIFQTLEINGISEFFVMSEFTISILFLLSMFLLNKSRNRFSHDVFIYVVLSLFFNIYAEIVILICRYENLSNLLFVGFFIKIIALHLLYKSVIETGLNQPSKVLFRNLRLSKLTLQRNQAKLAELINELRESSKEKENIFASMEDAVVVIDNNLKIAYHNQAFANKMNLKDGLINNKNIFEVMNLYDEKNKLLKHSERKKIINKIITGYFKGGY